MVEELFSADSSTKEVKVLGVKSSADLKDLKILINDTDITKNLSIKTLKIIVDKGEE